MRSGHDAFTIADRLETSGVPLTTEARRGPGCWLLLLGITLVFAGSSGCTAFQGLRSNIQYNDSFNDFVMGWRNSVWARQAWHEHKGEFVGEPQYTSFGQGFRDGYAAVAGGGNGCVPALPPRSFWTWKYQTSEGQAKVAAWYAGYPYGAKAAQEDGAGHYQQIQVSHLIEAQYSPEFRAGFCPGCSPTDPTRDQLPPGAIPLEEGVGGQPLPSASPQLPGENSPRPAWPLENQVPGQQVPGIPEEGPPPAAPPAAGASIWPPSAVTPLAQHSQR